MKLPIKIIALLLPFSCLTKQKELIKLGAQVIRYTRRAEWWHFDLIGWQEYEPLNLAFENINA